MIEESANWRIEVGLFQNDGESFLYFLFGESFAKGSSLIG